MIPHPLLRFLWCLYVFIISTLSFYEQTHISTSIVKIVKHAFKKHPHRCGQDHAFKKNVCVLKFHEIPSRHMKKQKKVAHDLLKHVHGFHELSMVDGNTIVSIAQFDTSANAMKFVRPQKKYPQIQINKLWVADNSSRMEPNQAKNASKLKEKLIELANIPPKHVIVSYKLFKVIVRDNGRFMPIDPIAFVKDDLTVDWNDASNVPAMVQEAMKLLISAMD